MDLLSCGRWAGSAHESNTSAAAIVTERQGNLPAHRISPVCTTSSQPATLTPASAHKRPISAAVRAVRAGG